MVEALRPVFQNLAISSLFRSAPIDVGAPQPDYINAVIVGETHLTALELFSRLKELERNSGRPAAEEGLRLPRVLDLDILIHGTAVISEPGLRIPHPGLTSRRFVLEPLAELMPGLTIPQTGLTVRELLQRAPRQAIERAGPLL